MNYVLKNSFSILNEHRGIVCEVDNLWEPTAAEYPRVRVSEGGPGK